VTQFSDLPERKNAIANQYCNPISPDWQTTCAASIFVVP
jgi:hypothetical protein